MGHLCSIDGCTNQVEAAGLCCGHRKRKTLGLPVNVPLKPKRGPPALSTLTPWQLLEKASEEYEDADVRDDAAYERARKRLAYAARVYAATLAPIPAQWRKPPVPSRRARGR